MVFGRGLLALAAVRGAGLGRGLAAGTAVRTLFSGVGGDGQCGDGGCGDEGEDGFHGVGCVCVLRRLLGRFRLAVQACAGRVCHGLALELAVRPDDRAGLSGGGTSCGREEFDYCPEGLASRRMARVFKSTWHNAAHRAVVHAMVVRGRDGEPGLQQPKMAD